MRRLLCLIGIHNFTRSLDRWGHLEVKECEFCQTHLNIHHGENLSFVSRKHSLLEDIKWMKKVLK